MYGQVTESHGLVGRFSWGGARNAKHQGHGRVQHGFIISFVPTTPAIDQVFNSSCIPTTVTRLLYVEAAKPCKWHAP